MNVDIGTETMQFPEKEYINGIFVAVAESLSPQLHICKNCPVTEVATYSQIIFQSHSELTQQAGFWYPYRMSPKI